MSRDELIDLYANDRSTHLAFTEYCYCKGVEDLANKIKEDSTFINAVGDVLVNITHTHLADLVEGLKDGTDNRAIL